MAPQKKKSIVVYDPEFEKECLDYHNKYRAMHDCPPLKTNANLTKLAKDWAEKLSARGKMQHRPKNKYGENIYTASGLQVNGESPVKMWYNEIEKYNFQKAEFSPDVGHFTQLIWKNTKEVGIAMIKRKDVYWVVANYDPPGNVVGQFKENVPPKK